MTKQGQTIFSSVAILSQKYIFLKHRSKKIISFSCKIGFEITQYQGFSTLFADF